MDEDTPERIIIKKARCLEYLDYYLTGSRQTLRSVYGGSALERCAFSAEAMCNSLALRGLRLENRVHFLALMLHDTVLLIDDSACMTPARITGLRWLLKALVRVYTHFNPSGVTLKFFLSPREYRKVQATEIDDIITSVKWRGDSNLGKALRKRVLRPLLEGREVLDRGLIVMVISDSLLQWVGRGGVTAVIKEIQKWLKEAERRDFVRLQFSFIGELDDDVIEHLSQTDDSVYGISASCVDDALLNAPTSPPGDDYWLSLYCLILRPVDDAVGACSVFGTVRRVQDHLEPYRLETKFHGVSSVSHTAGNVTTTWSQMNIIGSGGFGTVVLQRNSARKLRAVKSMKPDPRRSELSALVAVADREDLFVKFLGWYENTQMLYIAMEYIRGGDLARFLLDRKPSEGTVCEITRQILEGLVVLHDRKICHRDLKPQNILIARRRPLHVKIADFGASKNVEGTELRTRIGTDGYLAPEILGFWAPRAGGQSLTYALDLWSLGCIVHEMIAGVTPFSNHVALPTSTDQLDLYNSDGAGMEIDVDRLLLFCNGSIPLPLDNLENCGTSDEAKSFLKRTLQPNPSLRPTALQCLDSLEGGWRLKQTYDPEISRGESDEEDEDDEHSEVESDVGDLEAESDVEDPPEVESDVDDSGDEDSD